ncbi:MAG: glycosyl hydrolase 115 family protein [Bacteroidaceae bacterium]|nr:glycosyl hydrolase 115 family protein [Bacteroidaceae bacterium]
MKRLILLLSLVVGTTVSWAIDLTKATIVYNPKDKPLVGKMAQVLADDIERVSGIRPLVGTQAARGEKIVLSTTSCTGLHKELRGTWERFAIDTKGNTLSITGSDARGLAYGVLHVSEAIGVNPWYWFADVKPHQAKVGQQAVAKAEGGDAEDKEALPVVNDYCENFVSQSPTIQYRGIFINDEDWGLKTWSSLNFEKELGDIGPKTYDKVCELILRLKGNMLAPAMHTCTGAFYSHPESQQVADEWGIMITTSHCEPLLVNNAAPSEWDKERDGEWNYETNRERILEKFDNRLRETAQYHNIYTTGMRGLHDEAMKGSLDNGDRARTLEKVFADQRAILEKYKMQKASHIPQIFVPYKETLDIYDAGLRVPDDITLVWPDDNYGYMKRVSNSLERKRGGRSGVYYHLSYLGTPHDNLWIPSTAPMLMYEELLKAYQAGADRYWLLNVGDIKPLEVETQMFFDMAYDFKRFNYENANTYQAEWLAKVFGTTHQQEFQFILDNYYRLAWDRKPEFMGYEIEWDNQENDRLHDTDFSFKTGTAQKRLVDYQNICQAYEDIEKAVSKELRPALFEMLGYSVLSAYQMNRKYLYAQANHETGSALFAREARKAHEEIERLLQQYNTQLDGKWNQMMSEVPPGFVAKYQMMPELVDEPTDHFRLPASQFHPELTHKIELSSLADVVGRTPDFRLLQGIGTDWLALQMGEPLNEHAKGSIDIDIPAETFHHTGDSIKVCLSVLPMWPVAADKSNRIKICVDGGTPVVFENVFKEWSMEWKVQVLENRKEFVATLPLDKSRQQHTLTLTIVDPGQIVQKITYCSF